MNTTKQFWALFKFQSTINPFIWFMPVAFGTPLLIPLIYGAVGKDIHPSFSLLLGNQNMFFVAIFGAMILAPEKFQFGAAAMISSYYGTEFILTRAIDRPVLYRAKAAVLYLLILMLPCLGLLNSLRKPDLVVDEYAKPVQQACLAQVPGSSLLPSKWNKHAPSAIAIPRGNIMVAEWQMWVFLATGLTMQLAILVLYPFKYGKIVFWVFFFGLILVPLFDLTSLRSDQPTINDRLFFSFVSNPYFFWGITGLAFVLSQLWCERRYTRLEQ